ncbi:hypothetical protein C2E20_6540 [Micractinium conductrix]|uniref:Uncharacterized protein n=1 Tax=Micractinium conductrix TaxID=554055 RepID=A0A2P6V7I7_9CHLO|nr:hypothetical protein C2E20_6540 [Micractinium conductrix]|eukprot:PSC70047.1 hypothetical protein C2E20_6540 [Micractinium conductrix]
MDEPHSRPEGTGAPAGAMGAAHKTAEVPQAASSNHRRARPAKLQTGTGVVGSVEEAGHRGFYEAQGKLADAVRRGNEKLSGSS